MALAHFLYIHLLALWSYNLGLWVRLGLWLSQLLRVDLRRLRLRHSRSSKRLLLLLLLLDAGLLHHPLVELVVFNQLLLIHVLTLSHILRGGKLRVAILISSSTSSERLQMNLIIFLLLILRLERLLRLLDFILLEPVLFLGWLFNLISICNYFFDTISAVPQGGHIEIFLVCIVMVLFVLELLKELIFPFSERHLFLVVHYVKNFIYINTHHSKMISLK